MLYTVDLTYLTENSFWQLFFAYTTNKHIQIIINIFICSSWPM